MTLASRFAAPIVGYFDDIAPDYERWASGVQAKAATRLAALVEPVPGEHCLDVGTGTGLVARELAARLGPDANVIGIDPSPGMLREARKKRTPGIRYLNLCAEELVFRDGSFDVLTCGDSLPYFSDPFAALEEARRVLRPEGRIGVSCQTSSLSTSAQELSFAALVDMVREDGLQVPGEADHQQKLGEPQVLAALLAEYGFRDIRVTQLVTGFRATGASQWIEMLSGLGPFPHSVVSSMGSVRRARLAARLEPEMRRLGEDAWRIHHSFTLAVARR